MKSAHPLIYFIAVYEKQGNQYHIRDHLLKNVELRILQDLFNIDPEDPDPINRDMAYCYNINSEQGKVLEQFINFRFDFEHFDYMLEGRGDYDL